MSKLANLGYGVAAGLGLTLFGAGLYQLGRLFLPLLELIARLP